MDGRKTPEEIEAAVQAYLDGALDAAEAQALEALLDRSEIARAAFDRLAREQEGLIALFEAEAAAMAEARPLDLSSAAPAGAASRPSPRRFLWGGWAVAGGLGAAAGLALGVVLGAVALVQEPTPGPPGWRMSVAVYHRLYDADTFASAPVDAAGVAEGLTRIGTALSIDLGDLDAPDGLTLQRAQLLRFNDRPLGQIAFLDRHGAAIALCVFARKAPGEDPTPIAASTLLDMNAADWSAGEHDFLLLGPAAPEELRRYAEFFAERLG